MLQYNTAIPGHGQQGGAQQGLRHSRWGAVIWLLGRCETVLARGTVLTIWPWRPASRTDNDTQGARGKARRGAGQGAAQRTRERVALCLRYDVGAARHGSLRLQYGRAARPRYGVGLATTRRHAPAPGRAWCAGWASWGLMQPVWFLTWFFDSVVFLSHRLDSVHEHCSLQIIFPKKKILNLNKIKSNQIKFDKIFEK